MQLIKLHVNVEETWKYVMTKTRDQDLMVFFRGFFANHNKRHFLVNKFREDYDALYKRLEGNFGLQYLVNVCAVVV